MSSKNTPFKIWLEKFGIARLAQKLGVTTAAAHWWYRGHATPSIDAMQEIVKLSKGTVTYDHIIDHTKKGRADRKAKRLATGKKKLAKKPPVKTAKPVKAGAKSGLKKKTKAAVVVSIQKGLQAKSKPIAVAAPQLKAAATKKKKPATATKSTAGTKAKKKPVTTKAKTETPSVDNLGTAGESTAGAEAFEA